MMKKIYNNILELIGNTPMVKLNKLAKHVDAEIFLKLEQLNPGFSLKDRPALRMIEKAEKEGKLSPGGLIVEATSGNMGISLALIAAVKGYKCLFVQPDWMSKDKAKIMEAFGAEVVITETAVPIDDPRSYKSTARRLAEERGGFLIDQYSNPGNPNAHYHTTGPEIWDQMDGKIDYFVAGIGTGGTTTGVVKYLKEKDANIKFVAPDPEGSILHPGGKMGPFKVEGIGHVFVAKNVTLDLVDKWIIFKSKEAADMAIRLAREEGIMCGPSSGASVLGALRLAEELGEEGKGKRIVAFIPDSGERYVSYLYSNFTVPGETNYTEEK